VISNRFLNFLFCLIDVYVVQNLLPNLMQLHLTFNNLTFNSISHPNSFQCFDFESNPLKFPSNERVSREDLFEFFEVHNDLFDQCN
jgi:hypothetical protein